eukprot:EG_transcript_46838
MKHIVHCIYCPSQPIPATQFSEPSRGLLSNTCRDAVLNRGPLKVLQEARNASGVGCAGGRKSCIQQSTRGNNQLIRRIQKFEDALQPPLLSSHPPYHRV